MFSWIYPRVVETVDSPINGPIKILKSRGQYSIWVGGFEQSGGFYVEKFWRKAINNLTVVPCENILILGLGCGTVAKIIFHRWPKAAVIGVEIDPVMVALGKKYFNLSKIPNLKIENHDAREFVKSTHQKFNLVLVDTYVGNQRKIISIPKKLITKNGIVVTNSLIGLKNKLVLE